MKDPRFEDGAAIVAGGSGGIGREICRALAAAGSNVALTYRGNKAAADEAVASVASQGQSAEAYAVALEDFDDVSQFVEQAAARFGRIHSVVYAAGPRLTFSYAAKIDPREWRRVMDIDVNGCFNLVAATVPHLKRNPESAMAALITPAVERAPVQDILSAAPKAAIELLMRTIAKEEGRFGLRANCVGPGFIEAGLGGEFLSREGAEKEVAALRRSLPMQRFGSAADVADAVVFLLSSKAKYITGQSLAVDGGLQL